MKHALASMWVALYLCGCDGLKGPLTRDSGMEADYAVIRAASEAQAAFRAGDKRLLGVGGLTIEIPGIQLNYPDAKTRCGVKIIAGTSDAYENEAEHRRNINIREYAKQYNEVMIRLCESG